MTAAEVEAETEIDASPTELTEDALFDALTNERRRQVIRVLQGQARVGMRDLSETVAAEENDCTVDQLSSQEHKRVYVGLYQSHLPKLHDSGIISWDGEGGPIHRGETFDEAASVLAAIDRARSDEPVSLVNRILGGVGR